MSDRFDEGAAPPGVALDDIYLGILRSNPIARHCAGSDPACAGDMVANPCGCAVARAKT